MIKEQIKINESVDAELNKNVGTDQLRKNYEVISENGLFKNGRQINKGEFIELTEATAKNFIASGDIKEVQS